MRDFDERDLWHEEPHPRLALPSWPTWLLALAVLGGMAMWGLLLLGAAWLLGWV